MFGRFGKFLVIAMLATTLGVHWALLQTVAWTTMLADNLRSQSFTEAVEHTFDGKYPCPLCKAIAAGKKSQQKTEFTLQLQKLQLLLAKANPVLISPSKPEKISSANAFAEFRPQKPLLQPPRSFFA